MYNCFQLPKNTIKICGNYCWASCLYAPHPVSSFLWVQIHPMLLKSRRYGPSPYQIRAGHGPAFSGHSQHPSIYRHCSHSMRQGLCNGTVSVRLSVSLPQLSTAAASRVGGGFAAVGPAGRRYRSAAQQHGAQQQKRPASRVQLSHNWQNTFASAWILLISPSVPSQFTLSQTESVIDQRHVCALHACALCTAVV